MPDLFTPAKRSAVMAAIRGQGNKGTELRMIALMKAQGFTDWRRGQALVGRPDFVFRRELVVVFVDNCFWHGCPKHATRPVQNRDFWDAKLAGNKARDRKVTRELRAGGWKVLRIWEHELKRRNEAVLVRRLRRAGLGGGGGGV